MSLKTIKYLPFSKWIGKTRSILSHLLQKIHNYLIITLNILLAMKLSLKQKYIFNK